MTRIAYAGAVVAFVSFLGCCRNETAPPVQAPVGPAAPVEPAEPVEPISTARRCLPIVTTCDENLPCEAIERNASSQWVSARNGTVVTIESRCEDRGCIDVAIFPVPTGCGGESASPLIFDCHFDGDACVGGP
jgi:hypothetical protein